jgi:hypothetical protein
MGHVAEVVDLPVGRVLFADEQGVGLRATWHLERGVVNLSVWRENRCVETFRLAVGDAARLAGFLVEGLGEATAGLLRAINEPPATVTSIAKPSRVRAARTRLGAIIAP